MPRVYLADPLLDERSALRLVLLDLEMAVVGEAADWPATLANAPATRPEMLLISRDLLPLDLGAQALTKLREACLGKIVIVLISKLSARQQAVLSVGEDAFVSKSDAPERVALHLRLAAAMVQAI
jgi:DNA-binding NarL/FixJ family response regulator